MLTFLSKLIHEYKAIILLLKMSRLDLDSVVSQVLSYAIASVQRDVANNVQQSSFIHTATPRVTLYRGMDAFNDQHQVLTLTTVITMNDIIDSSLDTIQLAGPPPLSEKQISMLPSVQLTKEHFTEKIECSICLDDIPENYHVTQLPCNHYFHKECITKWLETQAACPICRETITVECDDKTQMTGARRSRMRLPNLSRRILYKRLYRRHLP